MIQLNPSLVRFFDVAFPTDKFNGKVRRKQTVEAKQNCLVICPSTDVQYERPAKLQGHSGCYRTSRCSGLATKRWGEEVLVQHT